MRVLVTGGTGFVGQALAECLVSRCSSVMVLSRGESTDESSRHPPWPVLHHDGSYDSLRDALRETKPDVVVHLAAAFAAEHHPTDVEGLVRANVLLGALLLEAMKETGCRRIVAAGTSWQHADGNDYVPVNLYASTKQAFEDIARHYACSHGFAVLCLLLFDTYGPGDRRGKLIGVLEEARRSGRRLAMSPGLQRINLVHVTDVAEAFAQAVTLVGNPSSAGSVYQYAVRGAETYILREVVRLFELAKDCTLDVGWGEKPYRSMEVMEPWSGGEVLPGWTPRVGLAEGLRSL